MKWEAKEKSFDSYHAAVFVAAKLRPNPIPVSLQSRSG